MADREAFISQNTKKLKARQAELVARGTPDEAIPAQIEQLGITYDAVMSMRVGSSPLGKGV